MKKFLLLAASVALSFSSFAQIDTIYEQYFDVPSQVNNINTYGLPAGVTQLWKDTNNLSISSPSSYMGQIQKGTGVPAGSQVVWQTPYFSTVGKRYVFLDFWQICKLYIGNRGEIQITTDGGNNWNNITSTNSEYLGDAVSFNSFFNEGSYSDGASLDVWKFSSDAAPLPSWWRKESFDISNMALDTAAGTGYAQVGLRFICTRILNPTTANPPRQYGKWYMDNVVVTASNCELYPPTLYWDFASTICPKEPLGQLLDPNNIDSSYTIAVEVTDTAKWGNSGVDSVWVKYRRGGSNPGPWKTKTFSLAFGFEYHVNINGLVPGDTIDYRVYAVDLGCPNTTVYPDSLSPTNYFNQFSIIPGLPPLCGTPYCSTAPGTIKNFPWTETFEGPEWIPAAASSTGEEATNVYRGDFPNEQLGLRYWKLEPNDDQAGYAWCIRRNTTPTPYTGPPSNHTVGGTNFLYVESNQEVAGNPPAIPHPDARLTTPCIDLTNETRCLHFEFWYHMFGSTMGNLQVSVDTSTTSQLKLIAPPIVRLNGAQQNFPNDPWKKGTLDLTPFLGKIIRIRFRGAKTVNGNFGDIAIDDLRIFEPDPDDAEIIALSAPVRGRCEYNNEPVRVTIRNNSACTTIQNFPVKYQINGGPVVTETVSTALAPTDTLQYTFNAKATALNSPGTYVVKAWVDLANDSKHVNDTILSDAVTNVAPYSTFPLRATFDNVPKNSSQTGHPYLSVVPGFAPNFKFIVGEEMTPTRNTGPYSGQYLGGRYLFTEGSNSTGTVTTYLQSEGCIDLTGLSEPTLDFFYHSFGTDIKDVYVQVSKFNEDYLTWNTIPGSLLNLTTATNNHNSELDRWKYYSLSLKPYLTSSPQLKVRVVVTRQNNTDLADFAIDNFVIYDKISQDAGVTAITKPDRFVEANKPLTGNTEVVLRNFGLQSYTTADVEFTVTPLCGPNQGVSTTYAAAAPVSVTVGTEKTVAVSVPNMTIPVGDCRICAYTKLTGDNVTFNDTVCKVVAGTGSYEIDFIDSFDDCNYDKSGFYSTGTYNQWQTGKPSGTAIPSAATSPNAWVTNLDGTVLDNTTEILYTPHFKGWDVQDLVGTQIRFSQNVDMPTSSAGFLQFQRNKSTTWSTLGATRLAITKDDINWYFNTFGNLSMNPNNMFANSQPGFEGSSNGWKFTQYQMNELNRTSDSIKFRFMYVAPAGSSNPSRGGWAIDNFEIFIPPQNSASPKKLKLSNPLPLPGQELSFGVTVENTGKKLLLSNNIGIIMDKGTGVESNLGIDSITTDPTKIFTEGRRYSHNFSTPWPGADVTPGTHLATVFTEYPNMENDDYKVDDTLEVPVDVLGEFEFTDVDTVYCNDFEPGNGAFQFLHFNSYIYQEGADSWQKGKPVQFGGTAVSGDNVWMTGLNRNYKPRDSSALFTPVFKVDSGMTFDLSFMHWFETEKYHDGGTFDASLDGGATWNIIGWPGEENWYNTQYVTALDIIKPGWTDTSGGWVEARHKVRFDRDAQVIFRFRFESDYTYEFKGWAIDDFCMKMTDPDDAAWTVGTDEYVPPVESYIGELSPNPAKDITHLPIFSAEPNTLKFTVVNILGQLVKHEEIDIDSGQHEWNLNTQGYKPGVYIINVEMDGEKYTRKLVVR